MIQYVMWCEGIQHYYNKVMSSKPKYIQFTIIEDKENQKVFSGFLAFFLLLDFQNSC